MDVSAATLRWQRWLITATVLLTPLLVWKQGDDNFALPQATFVVLVAVAALWITAIRWSWWRRIVLPRSPVVVAAAVFAVGISIATVTSTSRLQSVVGQHGQYTGLALYLACAVLFVATARAFTAETVLWLLRAIAIAMLCVAGYAILEMGDLDPLGIGGTQVVSTLGNSNFAAGWLSIALGPCIVLAFLRRGPIAWRWVGGLGAVAGVIAIQGTGAFQGPVAGGVAALVAAAGVVAVRQPLRQWWTRRNVVVAAVAILVVAAAGLAVGGSSVKRSVDNGLYDRKAF